MEDPNSTLLPYILEALSRKPELSDTFDNLCLDIELQLAQERNNKYTNVRKSIQRALNVGQSLGIISLTNETIRVPFNFRANGRTAKGAAATDALEYGLLTDTPPQPIIGTGNPPPVQEKHVIPSANASQKRNALHSPHPHEHHHENNNSNNNNTSNSHHKIGSSGHLTHSPDRNAKASKTHHGHHHCSNSGSHHASHHGHGNSSSNKNNNNHNRSVRHDDSDFTILPQRYVPQRKRGRPRRVIARGGYRQRCRSAAPRRKKIRTSSYGRCRSCRGRPTSYGRRTAYRR